MTLKQSDQVLNGSHLILYDQKKLPSIKIKNKNVDNLFDIRGIVHYELVSPGQTVNQVYCLEAVSYTHLDVYKRQQYISEARMPMSK